MPVYPWGMDEKQFIPLNVLARRTGLPLAWLKAQAQAKQLPCIKAGRRLMFDPIEVEQVLAERARQQVEGGAS